MVSCLYFLSSLPFTTMNLQSLILITFLLICIKPSNCSSNANDQIFEEWKRKFSKKYKSTLHEIKAKNQFYQNLKDIEEHNQRFDQGLETFRRGTWDRSDMSYEEKRLELTAGNHINETYTFASADSNVDSSSTSSLSTILPTRVNLKTNQLSTKSNKSKQPSSVPASIDWLAQGRVHKSVDDQVKCGSCYAFAAVSTLEGVALKNNDQTRYSVQQIIDCNKSTYGCSGGDPAAAMKYAVATGLSTSSDYPFIKTKGTCRNLQKSKSFSKSYTLTLNGNEQKLMETVAKYGPVAVAINVPKSFMNYESGVYTNAKCSKTPDHAVTVIGYGSDPKHGNYWLVKNSWGTSWGEAG